MSAFGEYLVVVIVIGVLQFQKTRAAGQEN